MFYYLSMSKEAFGEIIDLARSVNLELIGDAAPTEAYRSACKTLISLSADEKIIGYEISATGEFSAIGNARPLNGERTVVGRLGGFLTFQETMLIEGGGVIDRSSIGAVIIRPSKARKPSGYLCPIESEFSELRSKVDDEFVSDLFAEFQNNTLRPRTLKSIFGGVYSKDRMKYLSSVLSPKMLGDYVGSSSIYLINCEQYLRSTVFQINEFDSFCNMTNQGESVSLLIEQKPSNGVWARYIDLSPDDATFLP